MAFYAFVFSIPFETATDLPFGSLSKLLGCLFLLFALMQLRTCFSYIPLALLCFAVYLLWFWLFGMFDTAVQSETLSRGLTLIQMLVLFWVCCNLLRFPFVAAGTLWSLGASCGLCALLQLAGMTSTVGPHDRVSLLAENPNAAAAVLSLGFLSLLALTYLADKKSLWFRLAMLPVLGATALAIANTGSRGGLLALLAGLLILFMRAAVAVLRGHVGRIWVVAIMSLAVVGLLWASYSNPAARSRWEQTYEIGMGRREQIYSSSWEMFLEKPLAGWGPTRNTQELGRRLGISNRGMHNLALSVLTEVGLVGAIPYFIGVGLCLRSAWRVRKGPLQLLPLALLTLVLLINMKSTYHNRKVHWLILGLACASTVSATEYARAGYKSTCRPDFEATRRLRYSGSKAETN